MPKRNVDDVAVEGASSSSNPADSCAKSTENRRILRAAKKLSGSQGNAEARLPTADEVTVDNVTDGNSVLSDNTKEVLDSQSGCDVNNHNNVQQSSTKRVKSEEDGVDTASLLNGEGPSSSDIDHVTSSTSAGPVENESAQPSTSNPSGVGTSQLSVSFEADSTQVYMCSSNSHSQATQVVPKSILKKFSKYGPSVLNSSDDKGQLAGSGINSARVHSENGERTGKSSPVTSQKLVALSEPQSSGGVDVSAPAICATSGEPGTERESEESFVESLSDKEIENDNVFDSSNDAMETSPSQQAPLQQSSSSRMEQEKNSNNPHRTPLNQSPTSTPHAKDESPDLEPPRKKKKGVKFNDVKVYYFARKQGFICVPSQGGSTLGMADNHLKEENLTVSQHAKVQRELHKQILLEQYQQGKIHIPTPKLQQLQNSLTPPSSPRPDDTATSESQDGESQSVPPTSSQASENASTNADADSQAMPSAAMSSDEEEGEGIEAKFSSAESESEGEDELQVDDYYFLQPVPTRQRRVMLRLAGVKKIDAVEKDLCKDIRSSREVCGCDCTGVCEPETCICSLAGIKCQVDRPSFPCGCAKDCCRNPEGRIEFNPIRVRTHFIHTLMRLENERKIEQRKRAIAAAKRRRHLRFMEDGSAIPITSPQAMTIPSETAVAASNNSLATEEESDGEMDLSEFNSNEFGSCRDCQNSEVSHFLMRQQRQQQQARQPPSGVNVYAAENPSDHQPPSCMGTGGVQQAYMATVEDTTEQQSQMHQMAGGGACETETPGNTHPVNTNPGQPPVYGGEETYLSEAAAVDMFGFVQEEASYSESSEECSSVGSNPEAEGAAGNIVVQNQNFIGGGSTGTFPQQTKSLAPPTYDQSLMADHHQGNMGGLSSLPLKGNPSPLVKVTGLNSQAMGCSTLFNNIPPATGSYNSSLQSAASPPACRTAGPEQKYMELNGTATSSSASFKLEPISEILNPIRFPIGYPSGNWNGNSSASQQSGNGAAATLNRQDVNTASGHMAHTQVGGPAAAISQNYRHPSAPLHLHNTVHKDNGFHNGLQPGIQAHGSGDFCTLSNAVETDTVASSVVHNPAAGSAAAQMMGGHLCDGSYQSQVSSSTLLESTGRGPTVAPDLHTYKDNMADLTPLQTLVVVQRDMYPTATTEPYSTGKAPVSGASPALHSQVTSSSSSQAAAPNAAEQTSTKSYHQLTKSACHSASEAVYAAASNTAKQHESPSSTNLNVLPESPRNACCKSPPLSAMSTGSSPSFVVVEQSHTDLAAARIPSLETADNSTSSSSIQGLDQLVNSVPMATTEPQQNQSHGSSVGTVTSSDMVISETAGNEKKPEKLSENQVNLETLEAEKVVKEGGDVENGSTTDDSEDSGLGSMAEETATSTQDFGEIIKTSIVETVSA